MLTLASCASRQLFRTWRDESFRSGPLKHLMIVAIKKDQERRRVWEDGIADALKKHSVEPAVSYQLMNDMPADTARIIDAARAQNCDGILFVGKLHKRTEAHPGAAVDIAEPYIPSSEWTAWYMANYQSEYYPGYPVVDELVSDDFRVWAMQGGGRLIWSGVGEIRKEKPGPHVSGEMMSLIVSALSRQGVIP
jgi:hypothetical protein